MKGSLRRFVVFEGPDGVGKSSLLQAVAQALREQGEAVCTTREPGGSPAAEMLRSTLMQEAIGQAPVLSQLLLISAARVAHLQQTVRPALDAGQWVLCDRYVDSSYVYQCHLGGVPTATLDQLNQLLELPMPQLRLFLSLEPQRALERLAGRAESNRFDTQRLDSWSRLAAAYARQQQWRPDSVQVLDAAPDLATLRQTCLEILHAL
ncbi:MAG: dTMP kinase [Oceanococcaceae bacterium]